MIRGLVLSGRNAVLRLLGAATRRHAVLLDPDAARDARMLDVRGPYRVETATLSMAVHPPTDGGQLRLKILGYAGSFPTVLLWEGAARPCTSRSRVSIDLQTGSVVLDGDTWGTVDGLTGRRWCLDFVWTHGSERRTRRTGHYRPGESAPADADYYQGGTYVDHAAVEAEEARRTIDLLDRFEASGPVLEVGCATGGTLQALRERGLHAVGVDISEWAVEQARERLGDEAAFVCDAESDPWPTALTSGGPFACLILWAVLEHFRAPFQALGRLTELAAPGALLVVNTTNAESLTHLLFANDWEGHFDPTHYSVDEVSVSSLRERLPDLGWDLVHLETSAIWTGSADPTHAVLRDTYANDARFRRLLEEQGRGDFLILVARRK